MKTEQDYIREGVELADGWDCEIHGSQISSYIRSSEGYCGTTASRELLDALAAQLVRQVVELPSKFRGDTQIEGAHMIIHPGLSTYISLPNRWHAKEGTNTAMNTICAIIDAEVLK